MRVVFRVGGHGRQRRTTCFKAASKSWFFTSLTLLPSLADSSPVLLVAVPPSMDSSPVLLVAVPPSMYMCRLVEELSPPDLLQV